MSEFEESRFARETIYAIIGIIILAVDIGAVIALSVSYATIHGTVTVEATGLSLSTYTLDFGSVKPGENSIQTLIITNNGTGPETLSLTSNLGSMAGFIGVGWNCTNYLLAPQQTVTAEFTLAVGTDTPGIADFPFDLTITGTQA